MFWKKKAGNDPQPNKVTNALAKAIISCQLAFGNTLNRRTGKWTLRQQKIFLAAFVVVMVAITLFQLKGHSGNQMVIPISKDKGLELVLPRSYQNNAETFTARDSLAIEGFLQRMEELRNSPEGLDSLRAFERTRPGFIDSVLMLEKRMRKSQ